MLGKTFLILTAITFEIIFASTLMREIGRQFSISVRSLPCFSINVTSHYLASDFSVAVGLSDNKQVALASF